MTTDELYQFFGSARKAVESIGVTYTAFYAWVKKGFIPLKSQRKFEIVTKGKLIARIEDTAKKDENYPLPYYYDKKHGKCEIESIHFRNGKAPQVTFISPGKLREKFTAFITQKKYFNAIVKNLEESFKKGK